MTTYYLCFTREEMFEGYEPEAFLRNACKIVKLERANSVEELDYEHFVAMTEKALAEMLEEKPEEIVFSDIFTEDQILSAHGA